MNSINCPKCGSSIDIDEVLSGQIEARVIASEHQKHLAEIEKLKSEDEQRRVEERKAVEATANEKIKAQQELLEEKSRQSLELEREKMKVQLEGEAKKKAQQQELLIEQLREDAKSDKESAMELRELVKELREDLRGEKKARENAELEAQKKLSESEDKIRQDALKTSDESHRLKMLEMEKKLTDTQAALEAAQRKASQGSQQNQGEVLELDLEQRLREEFPFDDITEVKKGQRGADVRQTVKNKSFKPCGAILYETKNGKWQPAWVAKFKVDIREAGANVGIIVSQELPQEYGDMCQLDGVWVCKPVLAPVLAAALRNAILQVDIANHNNENKDEKLEGLYQFLVGPEFRHRVEAIVENYGLMQAEIEKEKRTAALRWSRQEKSIRAVIDNTLGMYGDLQGITGGALTSIKAIEAEVGEDVED